MNQLFIFGIPKIIDGTSWRKSLGYDYRILEADSIKSAFLTARQKFGATISLLRITDKGYFQAKKGGVIDMYRVNKFVKEYGQESFKSFIIKFFSRQH